MHDGPAWLEDPDDGPTRRGRPRRSLLVAIAVIPWLAVTALILLPVRSGDGPPVDDRSPIVDDDRSHGPSGTAASDPTDGNTAAPAEPSGRARAGDPVDGTSTTGHGPPEGRSPPPHTDLQTRDALAAVATVVARAWLTGVEPHLELPGVAPADPATYAEHVVVEAVDHDDPQVAVVSLLAVLLRETPEGLQVDTRRVAVPLAVTDGQVRPAGVPWWLPTPDLRPVELHTEAQSDPAWFEAAASGLTAAGLEDVEVTELERSDRWPWRARITARTAEGEHIDGHVWLRWTDHGFQLAGTTPGTTRGLPGSSDRGVESTQPSDPSTPEVPPGTDGAQEIVP